MENNKQQTPVDILFNRFLELFIWQEGMPRELEETYKEVKEIEKERMVDFAQSYAVIHCMGDITKDAEEYYEQTYGGGEQ